MCLPLLPLLGLAVSAAGTAAGIAQQQQSMNMQAQQFAYQQQMNQRQLDMQYQQAQRQADLSRQRQVAKHQADVRAQQAQYDAYNRQIYNNSEAANRVYIAEQVKMEEARTKAAFKSQEIYAKQIGAMGKVLSTGMTGQSVGLMALDTERQSGFQQAEQTAMVDSAEFAGLVQMDAAALKETSANNQAASKVAAPVQAPLLEGDPGGFGTNLNLGIPTYSWA